MDITIAIVDTGIDKVIVEKTVCDVKHYILKDNHIIEGYKLPSSEHGTGCFKEVLIQNKKFDILDINITDNNNALQISNVILGIKKAIELKADIVNVSLGFTKYPEELFEICRQSVRSNIVVVSAASHTDEISYPADLKNVLCIRVNNKQNKHVVKIDDSTLSIKTEGKIVRENGADFDFSSTSFACAYFSGMFASCLEDNPLLDKFARLKKLYNLNLDSDSDYIDEINYSNMEFYERIRNKKIAVVLMPFIKHRKISQELRLNNIVAYYDNEKEDFYSIDNDKKQVKNFDIILIINTDCFDLTVSNYIKEKFKSYEILFAGNFKNICDNEKALIHSHSNFINENMSILEQPLVLISGICWELGKFKIQQNLVQSFKKNKLNVKTLTYNPEGLLYNFDVFEYPEKIIFPDIVCAINNYIFCTESALSHDVWVINIGGGMLVNNHNRFSFGKLTEAYFHATDVDVLILCVPTFIDAQQLNLQISKANIFGIKNVIFVVSNYTFESSTLDAHNAMQLYRVDDEKYLNAVNSLKKNTDKVIFSSKEVEDGKLYEKIMNILD